MRTSLLVVALAAALVTPANAGPFNLVTNGDFSAGQANWAPYQAPITVGLSVSTPTGGNPGLYGQVLVDAGAGGLYQAISVTPGTRYTLSADWKVTGMSYQAELLFFNDDGRSVVDQLVFRADSSVIARVDDWETRYSAPNWTSATSGGYWYPSGPCTNTVTATGTVMYVGLRAETAAMAGVTAGIDNIAVQQATPEPASMLLLLAGAGVAGKLRRRRHTR